MQLPCRVQIQSPSLLKGMVSVPGSCSHIALPDAIVLALLLLLLLLLLQEEGENWALQCWRRAQDKCDAMELELITSEVRR